MAVGHERRAGGPPPAGRRALSGAHRIPVRGPARTSTALLLATLAACGPDALGPRLYVTSGFTDEVLVLDPRNGDVVERISVDRRPGERDEPHGVAVAPDGAHWYATVSHGEPSLWKFETEGDRLVGRLTLPTAGASRVGVSPDGRWAAVPDYWLGGLGADGRVAKVRLHDLVLEASPEVCPAPHDAQWDPSGSRVAVTCVLSDEVVVLDGGSFEPLARFPVKPEGGARARPMNVAWAPSGDRLYVTLMDAERVGAFTPEGGPLWTLRVPRGPAQIAVTRDGRWLAVATRMEATLALVDTEQRKVWAVPLPEAMHPHGVALDASGTTAYVAYEGTTRSAGGVVAVGLEEGEVLWRAEAGVFTLGVAYFDPSSPGAPSSGSSSSDRELMQ